MILRIVGCKGVEFPAGAATGTGSCGSSSRYLLGKRDVRRGRADWSSVGFWGSVDNIPGGTEGGMPVKFSGSGAGACLASSEGGFPNESGVSDRER